jgi:hypothetical protein
MHQKNCEYWPIRRISSLVTSGTTLAVFGFARGHPQLTSILDSISHPHKDKLAMRLLFKNNIFKMAACLAVLQQVFVGLSTFMIGSAGAALDQPNRVLWLLAAFFGSSAVAYVIGTSVQWLAVRLSNNLWSTYTKHLLSELSQDIGYASDANKKRTNTWLTGEALSTLEYASTFSLDFLSIS